MSRGLRIVDAIMINDSAANIQGFSLFCKKITKKMSVLIQLLIKKGMNVAIHPSF